MVSGKTFGCPKNIWYIHNTGWVHIDGYPLTGLQRGDLPRAVSGGAVLAGILSLRRPLSGRALFTPSQVEIDLLLKGVNAQNVLGIGVNARNVLGICSQTSTSLGSAV